MAVIVNGDGILTGISSLATALTDLTSGRGTVTGVATVGTLQLGAGVSISSPRAQQAAIFTNNTEFLTVDDAGRVGVGTITPNSDAHPENEKKINVGFITARSIAGDIDANTMVVAGVSTFVGAINGTLTGTASGNAVLTGSTNNQLVTVTGANAITGEANLNFDGTALGINISSPGAPLEIRGAGGTNDAAIYFRRDGSPPNDAVIGQLLFRKGTDSVAIIQAKRESALDDAYIQFQTQPTGGNVTERLRITSTGKIGVNITPTGQFSVKNSDDSNLNTIEAYNDNGNLSGSFAQNSSGDGTVGVRKNDGTLSAFFRSNGASYVNGGDFGIGTNSPSVKCDISDSDSTAWGPGSNLSTALRVVNSSSTNDVGAGIQLRTFNNAGAAGIQYIHCVNSSTNYSSDLVFSRRLASSGSYAEACRITNAGNLKFPSSQGIDFSATGSGSGTGTSELFDDYEEGTFSATASATGYSGGSAISMSDEKYTKIGRIVHFNMRLAVASNLNDGDLTITNLPFTAAQDSVVNFSWQDAAGFHGGQGKISGTSCVRHNGTFPTHSSGTANIIFSGTYRTAS